MATKQTPKKTGLAVLHTELCGYIQVERVFREQLAEAHGERLTKLEAQVTALYDDFATHRKLCGEEITATLNRQDAVAARVEELGRVIVANFKAQRNDDEVTRKSLVQSERIFVDSLEVVRSTARWNLAINIGVTLGACVVTYFLGQWTR